MVKMKKKFLNWGISIGLLFIALVLTAYGSSEDSSSANDGDIINIGILLSAEHSALTSAQEGFIEELEANGLIDGENIKINVLNSQGSSGNLHDMAQQLANESDLPLGISTSRSEEHTSELQSRGHLVC